MRRRDVSDVLRCAQLQRLVQTKRTCGATFIMKVDGTQRGRRGLCIDAQKTNVKRSSATHTNTHTHLTINLFTYSAVVISIRASMNFRPNDKRRRRRRSTTRFIYSEHELVARCLGAKLVIWSINPRRTHNHQSTSGSTGIRNISLQTGAHMCVFYTLPLQLSCK